jgi:hypothetical protein
LEKYKKRISKCYHSYYDENSKETMDIKEGIIDEYSWGKYWENYELIPKTLSGVFGNYPTN